MPQFASLMEPSKVSNSSGFFDCIHLEMASIYASPIRKNGVFSPLRFGWASCHGQTRHGDLYTFGIAMERSLGERRLEVASMRPVEKVGVWKPQRWEDWFLLTLFLVSKNNSGFFLMFQKEWRNEAAHLGTCGFFMIFPLESLFGVFSKVVIQQNLWVCWPYLEMYYSNHLWSPRGPPPLFRIRPI